MTRNGTGKIVAATTLMTILAGGTLSALQGAITRPAWKTKPTWYLIATEDRMIPPPAQRAMAERAGATISEVASHSLYVSQPEAVVRVITTAAGVARQAVAH